MLRVDQVHVVRHKVLVEGCSQRQVARELGIARDTVRKYLTESIPVRKERQPRARPVWDRVRTRVEQLLTESVQWTGGKQRLTATRLHELLVTEGHRVGVTMIKDATADYSDKEMQAALSPASPPTTATAASGRTLARAALRTIRWRCSAIAW